MAVNPDNFIFNSDYLYNYPLKSGTASIGSGFINLATGMSDEYRFKVVLDSSDTVYGIGGGFPTLFYYVDSGALKAASLFESGTYHYRVYDSEDLFIFNSDNYIDKVVFSATGEIDMGGFLQKSITNTYGGKMMLFAIWRNVTNNPDIWLADGQGSVSSGTLGLTHTVDTIYLNLGALDLNVTIEYKIVGIPLDITDDKFVFNSDQVPLNIPYNVSTTMTSSSSLDTSETKVTYGDWIDTGIGTVALDSYIQIQSRILPFRYQDFVLASGVTMTAHTESNADNQVRLVLTEVNGNANPVSLTPVDVYARFYMTHIAI